MKKLIVSLMAGAALVVGAAGTAGAQADPVVTLDKEEVAASGDVTINVAGAEANAQIQAALGEGTAEGTADAEGNGSVTVNVGNVELGEIDGLVTINGQEVPIRVLVVAASGDGTPQPTAVNTGDGLGSSTNSMTLFAVAAGLFLLGGGALVLRHKPAPRR